MTIYTHYEDFGYVATFGEGGPRPKGLTHHVNRRWAAEQLADLYFGKGRYELRPGENKMRFEAEPKATAAVQGSEHNVFPKGRWT